MIRQPDIHKSHFHILWSDGKLDWERHNTRAEAEASAKEFTRLGEGCSIVERDQSCPECKASPLYGPKHAHA